MNKNSKKAVLKYIKENVLQLPIDTYNVNHRYHKPIKEETENGHIVYRWGYTDLHVVNHKRRAYQMYKRHGIDGLNTYFKQYGFELKKIEVEEKA